MKNLICILFLAFSAAAMGQQKNVQLLSPEGFAKKIQAEKSQILDVRTPGEYKAGHIAGAANIHLYDADFEQRVQKLDKNKPVYVYCKAGGRSAEAVEIMQAQGFRNIVELKGGTDAWAEAGKPLVK